MMQIMACPLEILYTGAKDKRKHDASHSQPVCVTESKRS